MQCAALATLPNFLYPSDVFPSSRFYAEDLSTPAIAHSSPWHVTLTESPGTGATPDIYRLKKRALEKPAFGI